jgi:glyoxylase-like metal-dependent hydrolase (beta-lactamase superfamily II)
MKLEEIAPRVFACLQQEPGLGFSNSGLIDRGGGLIVDTFWDLPHTREMIERYSKVWRAPARRVVNTHYNGDHCWGNQLFPRAEIIGHRRCAESFSKENPAALQAVKSMDVSGQPGLAGLQRGLEPWDFSGIDLKPPSVVFDDRLTIEMDGSPVEIVYVGPAHTDSDVIVHVPESRVVFAGDIVFRLCSPIGWEGTYARWIAALDYIISLNPDVVVPGHGPLCGVEGPREMKAYLVYVREESKRFFEAGLPVDEAARRIDLGPYEIWDGPERVFFNVERAYRELRGDPPDAPVNANFLFAGATRLYLERWANRPSSREEA